MSTQDYLDEGKEPAFQKLRLFDYLFLLMLSGGFAAMGYLVSNIFGPDFFLFLAARFLPGWSPLDTGTAVGIIKDPLLQALFGLPLISLSTLPFMAAVLAIFIMFPMPNRAVLTVVIAPASFLFGMLAYFPLQMLLIFAGSI
jgi:hypothetical protein